MSHEGGGEGGGGFEVEEEEAVGEVDVVGLRRHGGWLELRFADASKSRQ